MRQVGNAVPVLLAETIACELMKTLRLHIDVASPLENRSVASSEVKKLAKNYYV
jgi:hypothetical protein